MNLSIPVVGGWEPPHYYNLANPNDAKALDELVASGVVLHASDHIEAAIEELFHIEQPAQIDAQNDGDAQTFRQHLVGDDPDKYGVWVFFPWSGTLTHFPPMNDLRRLRGSRNRNLITEDERRQLVDNKTILIAGLSVGSNAVDSLLMAAIGSRLIIVDMDQLDPTNLNRIRAAYDQLGIHKVDIIAKKISELDPYLEQIHYKNGLDAENLEEILTTYHPDIIMDEMDSLHMKVLIRRRAQALRIPVLMATDDGDDILLDIERFDLQPDAPILHGLLPEDVVERILHGPKMSRPEMGTIIGRYFVNLENVPVRMLESLMQVGQTLPSWPQLGGAAVLSGLYLSYAAKRILLGLPLTSGRFLMGPEPQLNPELTTSAYKQRKAALIERMSAEPKPSNVD